MHTRYFQRVQRILRDSDALTTGMPARFAIVKASRHSRYWLRRVSRLSSRDPRLAGGMAAARSLDDRSSPQPQLSGRVVASRFRAPGAGEESVGLSLS